MEVRIGVRVLALSEVDCKELDVYFEWLEKYAAPFYRVDKSGVSRNGTMVFMRKEGGPILGVTASHVYDSNRRAKQNGEHVQIGSAVFEDSIFAPIDGLWRKPEADQRRFPDISTCIIPELTLGVIGIKHQYIQCSDNIDPDIKETDFTLWGGFPETQTRVSGDKWETGFLKAFGGITISTPRQITLKIKHNDWILPPPRQHNRPSEESALSGCSGGPVFRRTYDESASGVRCPRLELVAIIHENSLPYSRSCATPLNFINADGTIRAYTL